MEIDLKRISENLINMCTAFLFASFFIFESYTWGRFILVGVSAIIFFLYIVYKEFQVKIHIGEWHSFVFMFGIISLITALVSIRPSDAIGKFMFIIQILICFTPIYAFYDDTDKVKDLLNVIKWAGYTVAIYSIYFYGLNFVFDMLKDAIRLENSFSNINVIGQISAIAIIIQVYQIFNLDKKNIVSWLFMIPTFFIILATQSRKAFVLLIMGVFLVYIVSIEHKNKTTRIIMRILIAIIALVLMLSIMTKFPIFSGINERMGYLIDSLEGNDGAHSANLRKQMIQIGWNSFLHNPFLGIGIGSPHIVAFSAIGEDAYLHNNYIELLCGGGIIGFFAFYSIYVHLLKGFWRFRKVNHYAKKICVILMVSFLVMEWGKVSCYSKETYFYFMVFFLEMKQLKERWYND